MANWAKTLAGELGQFAITVNNVLPGYTATQRLQQILDDRVAASGKSEQDISAAMLASVPLGRFASASEIAAVIAFLASPAAGYVSGVNIPVEWRPDAVVVMGDPVVTRCAVDLGRREAARATSRHVLKL